MVPAAIAQYEAGHPPPVAQDVVTAGVGQNEAGAQEKLSCLSSCCAAQDEAGPPVATQDEAGPPPAAAAQGEAGPLPSPAAAQDDAGPPPAAAQD